MVSGTAGAVPDHEYDQDGKLDTAGTGAAYTVKTARKILGNYRGLRFCAKVNVTNTGACTMKVDEAPAVSVKLIGNVNPPAGAIIAGGYYDFIYDDVNGVFQAAMATQREYLTADRTYYVRTDGSDSNTGLANTSAGAFRNIQKAYDVVASTLDLADKRVVIQVGSGTYTDPSSQGAVLKVTQPWVGGKGPSGVGTAGGGAVQIKGDETTPANVVVSCGTSYGVFVNCGLPGVLDISGVKFTGSGSAGAVAIFNNAPGSTINIGKVDFGAMGTGFSRHMWAAQAGVIFCYNDNYTISGGAACHAFCEVQGAIDVELGTVTLTGTPAFTDSFVRTESGGVYYSAGNFSGSATGPRFNVRGGGHIRLYDTSFGELGAAALTRLPGNAAGVLQPGGSLNQFQGGGLVTIASGSLSGSTVNITNITDDFSSLLLSLNNVSFDTAARAIRVLASDNNGASFDTTGTNYFGVYLVAAAAVAGISGVATLIDPGNNTLAADTASANLTLKSYQTPGSRMAEFVSFTSGGGTRFGWMQWFGGSGGALNALQIALSGTGSFDGGSYTLYGIY